ncbi:MAG: PolC-type DNA polymerase III, partial [Bacillota bacterium]
MENAFETLLKLLELNDLDEPINGKLIELEVDESTRTWFFNMALETPLDIKAFKRFINRLESLPAFLESCENVDYMIDYDTVQTDQLEAYYHFALEQMIERKPRYNAMSEFGVETEGDTLFVVCPKDGYYVEDMLADIKHRLYRYGFDVELNVRYCEQTPSISERIEELNGDEAIEEETQVSQSSEPVYEAFKDRTVHRIRHKISDIPASEQALMEYKSANHNADFIIEGTVQSFEQRTIKKNTDLYTFVLSSDEDSIYVKKFVRDKEEARFLNAVQERTRMKVKGSAQYDTFSDEVIIIAQSIERTDRPVIEDERVDRADKKRVELQLHSKMSTLDGIDAISDYVAAAARFGHDAIALTDHNTVQAFPEFEHAAKRHKVKPIYGAELSIIDEANTMIASGHVDTPLSDATYTVFDLETTGLSVHYDKIIEISAVKVKNHQVIEEFNEFVNPEEPLSEFTKRLTGIKDSDVKKAPTVDAILPKFKAFFEGTVFVAHNAPFDMAHLEANLIALDLYDGPYPVIDTLQIARQVYAEHLKRFNLKAVAKHFKVELTQHHRAIYDTLATKDIFLHMLSDLNHKGVTGFEALKKIDKHLDGVNRYQNARAGHLSVLVKNPLGLKNLYRLISEANTTHFDKEAKLPKKVLIKHRDGLLIGSGCMNSDFFETALNRSEEELKTIAEFFDYLEIQPPEDYHHLGKDMPDVESRIEDTLKRIIRVGEELDIPVVASSDAHHIDKNSVRYRDIYVRTPIVGGGYHTLSRYETIPSQYFRTTGEMKTAFKAFDASTVERIVVDNTRKIADSIATFDIFPRELFAPTDDFLALRGVPSIEKKMIDMVYSKAYSLYGDPLHPFVKDRLDREMISITENKFSTVYYISHLLVKKSLDEGYLVGSRGSVGSSFVAMLMDITEVNPLSPHYVCPSCHFASFKMSPEEKETFGIKDEERGLQTQLEEAISGFDLKDVPCPECGTTMRRDGHDIPFETFLGFKGDKVPDIDLNFSGDYQGRVHEYIRELFGHDHAFRAGTISTVASKTAYGYVKGYVEKKNITLRKAEIERRAKKITGVKRSTGQHPGGIVVVPHYRDIYDVTPVQYPADDTSASWRTTHFDYHAFEDNLFKLDVLGHDDPTMIRFLMDYVKKDPISFPFKDARDIPINDPKVYKMLSGTEVLNLKPSDIGSEVASFGIPEMGTSFVRSMLRSARPKTFADIVKISGLSHGTDVWLNNAEELVNG